MDYFPAVSPSSCSDDVTLVGSPESPNSSSSSSSSSASSTMNNKNRMFDEFSSKLQIISKEEKERFTVDEESSLLLKSHRRNAISFQSSNDDTIVSHGPSFGAVFGNVKGGRGSLNFSSNQESQQSRKRQTSENSLPKTPSSIAFYLSPTYGLPGLPFDFIVQEKEEEEVKSAFSSSDESTSSIDRKIQQNKNEEEIILKSSIAAYRRRYKNRQIPRSPALTSLSAFLEEAPIPPLRNKNEKNASLSAPLLHGKQFIRSNRKFFDQIQINSEKQDEKFCLQLPPNGKNLTSSSPSPNSPLISSRPKLYRSRQSSQRIPLQDVVIQATTPQ